MHTLVAALTALALLSAAPSGAQSTPGFLYDQRLEASDISSSFASACAVDWGVVAVGAPYAGNGAVVVFKQQPAGHFVREALLTCPSPSSFTGFGANIACQLPYLVVGAPGERTSFENEGAAYVFERVGTGWVQRARLVSPTPRGWAWFGNQVDLSGDVLIVAEKGGDGAVSGSGAAHVFRRSGTSWNLEQTLLPSDGFAGMWFGWSVAIRGDGAFVGAIGASAGAGQRGAVYAFNRNAGLWSQSAKLSAPVGTPTHFLGHAVDVVNGRLAAAEFDSASTAPPGAAHVWRWEWQSGSWVYEQRVAWTGGGDSGHYGESLALTDRRLFVGAPLRGDGTVCVYDLAGSTWSESARLGPPDAMVAQRFGSTLAANDYHLAIDAPNWWDVSVHGVAHVYRVFDVPLVGELGCTASAVSCPCGNSSPPLPPSGCLNSTSHGGRLYGLGTDSVSQNDLRLCAEGLPGWRLARAIGALAAQPGVPIADGVSCIGAPRTTLWPVWADGAGHAEWSGYFQGPLGWESGQTWHFQVWYRDPLTICGGRVNLTNMLSLTLTP